MASESKTFIFAIIALTIASTSSIFHGLTKFFLPRAPARNQFRFNLGPHLSQTEIRAITILIIIYGAAETSMGIRFLQHANVATPQTIRTALLVYNAVYGLQNTMLLVLQHEERNAWHYTIVVVMIAHMSTAYALY